MIVLDVEQGSDEWKQARLGIPTSSDFGRIITPKGEPSKSAVDYAFELAGEWLTGMQSSDFETYWMRRGKEVEPEARDAYSFITGTEVQQVGIVALDDRSASCSPDFLVGDDGGGEIKCPKSSTLVQYLIKREVPPTYIPQIQGNLWITEREWWDFVAYHPGCQPMIVRVNRDEAFIRKLIPLVASVNRQVESLKKQLEAVQ